MFCEVIDVVVHTISYFNGQANQVGKIYLSIFFVGNRMSSDERLAQTPPEANGDQ